MTAIEADNTAVTSGGRWKPTDCVPRHKVNNFRKVISINKLIRRITIRNVQHN